MATRARNHRGQGERLRETLLDAASELLAESRDGASLSVRAVTARAGVSPTALYLHFADKEELTGAVKRRCFAAFGEALRAAEATADASSASPRDRVVAIGRAYLCFAREQPGQYAILFQTHIPKGAGDSPRADQPGVGREAFDVLVEAVSRARPAPAGAFDFACVMWMALHGRTAVGVAMPGFPFPEEERYLALVVDSVLGA